MKKLLVRWFGKATPEYRVDGLNGINRIYNRSEFHNLLELERDRVHRNNHQFSVLLFSVNPQKEHDVIELASHISKRVRRIDQVGWYDDSHIGVLLPNTTASGAKNIVKDICSRHNGSTLPLVCETLSYPETTKLDELVKSV